MGQDIITGNYFDKYNSKNPVYRALMNGFFKDLKLLISSIDTKQNIKILEAGCGEGHLASILLNSFVNVNYTGFDIDKEMIQQAKDLMPSAKFNVGSIYELDTYKQEEFDLCLVSEVLEHLDEPQKALRLLSELSSEYYLFSVPREPVWRILNVLRLKYIKDLGNTPGHFQHWSKKHFIQTIKSQFDIVEIKSPFPWTMILAKRKIQS